MTKLLYVEHNDDNLYMLKTRLELRGGFEFESLVATIRRTTRPAVFRPIGLGLDGLGAARPDLEKSAEGLQKRVTL